MNCPLDIGEVIRQMATLKASYPDIVAILMNASNQKNLPGPMVVDAVPLPNKAYDEAQLLGIAGKQDDSVKKTAVEDKKSSLLDRVRNRFKR